MATYWTVIVTIFLVTSLVHEGNAFTMDVNPKSVIQPARTSVRVDCTATGTQPPTITWYADGKPIQSDSQRVIYSNGSLYIPVLRRKFAGLYKCEAKDVELNLSFYASVQIQVATLSKMSPMEDVIDIVGNRVNITCPRPNGNPPPVVRWTYGDGSPLPKDPRFQFSGWSLIIDVLRFDDTNNYTCVAENIGRNRTSMVKLTAIIPGGNQLTPLSSIVVENQTAVMSCKSLSNPPLAIVWKRSMMEGGIEDIPVKDLPHQDNYIIHRNGTFVIKRAKMSDNGTYVCVSEIKTSFYKAKGELTVQELVKLDGFVNHKQYFNYDDRDTPQKVVCQFRGYGNIVVRWRKEGLATLPDRMSSQANELVIDKIDFKDAGVYICDAIGPYNSATGRINVSVLVFPQFTLRPENASATAESPVWVHCKGSGVPAPRVSWVREDTRQQITVNGTYSRVLSNGTMYIPKSRLDDTGEYMCILSNGPTIETATSFVHVSEKKVVPGKGGSQPEMGRTIAIAVGCAGAYIFIVVGLMIYCRSRRSRMLREQNLMSVPIEDGEGHNDPLLNNDVPLDPAAYQFPREDLEELDTVGRGKIGRVFTAKACGIADGAMKALVAVKELVAKDSVHRDDFESEIGMLATLKHDCVVKLLGICTESYPLLMITEYSDKGDLKEFLLSSQESRNGVNGVSASHHPRISPVNRMNICHHVAAGMEYLASNRLIHRDLAARNCVILANMEVKVAFLSLCEDRYASDYYVLNGVSLPLRWLSPEVINDEQYSEKSDVWAYGVAIWEVYSSGAQPYSECSDEAILKYLEGDLRLPRPAGCSNEMWKLMQSCWLANPNDRPGFSAVMATMNEMPMDSNV